MPAPTTRIEVYQRFPDAGARAKFLAREYKKAVLVCRTVGGFAVAVPTSGASVVARQHRVPSLEMDAKFEAQERYRQARGETTSVPKSTPDRVPLTPQSTFRHRAREAWTEERSSRLLEELQHAFRNAPRQMLIDWAQASSGRFGVALVRRLDNGKELLLDGLGGLGSEVNEAYRAMMDAHLVDHVMSRWGALSNASAETVRKTQAQVGDFSKSMQQDPVGVGSKMVVAALAFHFLGGGMDGDGGIPDLDIEFFGIGGHRSIFTHSIFAGAVVETGLYSLYDFLNRGHQYLPSQHDPLWDKIHAGLKGWLASAASGASAGLAYHFGIDATLHPGYFRDLPFTASSEMHQAILGASAVSEAAAGRQRSSDRDTADLMTGVTIVAGTIAAILFGG